MFTLCTIVSQSLLKGTFHTPLDRLLITCPKHNYLEDIQEGFSNVLIFYIVLHSGSFNLLILWHPNSLLKDHYCSQNYFSNHFHCLMLKKFLQCHIFTSESLRQRVDLWVSKAFIYLNVFRCSQCQHAIPTSSFPLSSTGLAWTLPWS